LCHGPSLHPSNVDRYGAMAARLLTTVSLDSA
jgi:hypothetical protein